MAPKQRPVSSGSDGDLLVGITIDERKINRMRSNRESARRSRMRKQKQLGDLINLEVEMKTANKQLVERINVTVNQYDEIQLANNVLRAQVMELTERLLSLTSVLKIVEEVSGLSLDIPKIPDHFMEPWKLPCPTPPVAATADMFNGDKCL